VADDGGLAAAPGAFVAALDVLAPAEPGESWTVLYTRSRCEKLAARACAYMGARHYLPLREHSTGRDRRGRRYQMPLFPSYVFACLTYRAQLDVLATSPIARVIPAWHPDLLLAELRQIRRALERGADITVGPALARGELVRVIRGPLAGVEGLVVALRRRRRRHELVLNVTMLGRAVVTEIDVFDVMRVPRVEPASSLTAGRVEAAYS
jgi:transcription antitermination factor NusG